LGRRSMQPSKENYSLRDGLPLGLSAAAVANSSGGLN
jgi:hypothetical protein